MTTITIISVLLSILAAILFIAFVAAIIGGAWRLSQALERRYDFPAVGFFIVGIFLLNFIAMLSTTFFHRIHESMIAFLGRV